MTDLALRVRLQPGREAQLAEIAAKRGVTKEELARDIICRYLEKDRLSAVEPAKDHRGGFGSEIAALFSKHGLDSPIPELRGFTIQIPFESSPKKATKPRPADTRGRLSPPKPSPTRQQ